MSEVSKRMARNKYVVIDYYKLDRATKDANAELKKKDGITLSERLEINYLPSTTIPNSRINANRYSDKSVFDEYEYCVYGLMNALYLNKICEVFSLKPEDYMAKKKKKEDNESDLAEQAGQKLRDLQGLEKDVAVIRVKSDATFMMTQELLNQLIKITEHLEALGRVDLESVEQLKKISEGIKTMNDKYNKPSAYLRR